MEIKMEIPITMEMEITLEIERLRTAYGIAYRFPAEYFYITHRLFADY